MSSRPSADARSEARSKSAVARALLIDADESFVAELLAQPGSAELSVERAKGALHALRLLRRRFFDVVLTSPRSEVSEDLALVEEMRDVRPGTKAIVLAPNATAADVVAMRRLLALLYADDGSRRMARSGGERPAGLLPRP